MIFGLSNLHGSFFVSALASKNVAYMWMGKREQTQQKISEDRVDDIKYLFRSKNRIKPALSDYHNKCAGKL